MTDIKSYDDIYVYIKSLDVKGRFRKLAQQELLDSITSDLCYAYLEKFSIDESNQALSDVISSHLRRLESRNELSIESDPIAAILDSKVPDEAYEDHVSDTYEVMKGSMKPEDFIAKFGRIYEETIAGLIEQ